MADAAFGVGWRTWLTAGPAVRGGCGGLKCAWAAAAVLAAEGPPGWPLGLRDLGEVEAAPRTAEPEGPGGVRSAEGVLPGEEAGTSPGPRHAATIEGNFFSGLSECGKYQGPS